MSWLLAACSAPPPLGVTIVPPPAVTQLAAPGVSVRFNELEPPTLAPTATGVAASVEPTWQVDELSLTLAAPAATPTPAPQVLPTADPADYDINFPQPELVALADEVFGASKPARLVIPAIDMNTPVTPVGWRMTEAGVEWDSPRENAGFLVSSAAPGAAGNTVIYGHNNIYGELFRWLSLLSPGDAVLVITVGGETVSYTVEIVEIFEERGITPEQQAANLAYFNPTNDTRLTLLSCWPYTDNSHRVAVVARPGG